ncbi:LysR family transcriptional regulator [Streptodolium elevatio]
MQLQQLRAFREVARERSFTRAAHNLHYSQSSITAQVQNLEAAFGVPLFRRGGRHATLTDEGRCLLPYAERIIETAEEAHRHLATTHPADPPRTAPAHAAVRPAANRAA